MNAPLTKVTQVDPLLLAAYRAAHYVVCTEVPFALRIDTPSLPLAALYGAHSVDCAGFVTAANPASHELSVSENARRLRALTLQVEAAGFRWIAGYGRDPAGHWPDEPSLLVLGAPLEWARELALLCGQNALVWVGDDATPRLFMTA